MKLFDWLNQGLYVDLLKQEAATGELPPVDRSDEVEALKAAMGSTYLLHKSNQVQRKDGRRFAKVKLRKVN